MSPAEIESRSTRVLVVEDNSDDQELLLRQLRKMNFHEHVKFVNNGKKALGLLTEDTGEISLAEILVVFLDLKLPEVGGLEILQQIRAKPATAMLPVIVMSSYLDPATLAECQRLKVLKYVPKPVTYQTFSMAVASVFHLPRRSDPGRPRGLNFES